MNLTDFLISKLEDLKATDIVAIDVRGRSSITDTMIIGTGTSVRHVSAMAQRLMDECKTAGIEAFGQEGQNTAEWVVVDFGQAIVHILQSESRVMYQLEQLWTAK
ncbi:ribosome silencing factor RsfS [Actinobacillus delphinicola]|uniref:Ribosomal silencing factor RsfS n=1 Tax=Actinobacillus delphinicola TaxID=51161 RepID=A0A448TSR4_9PAST|nr:ribosome silencing factor [Actinobacillus delphinicola]MDG6897257.1 ribosome silencing factor RsfS [Actinobacillus delphinicola]VEJ09077.1 plant Iojap-like protein [Actinobacillus delphinicola]